MTNVSTTCAESKWRWRWLQHSRQNVSHCRQQSYSGLCSLGWSCLTYLKLHFLWSILFSDKVMLLQLWRRKCTFLEAAVEVVLVASTVTPLVIQFTWMICSFLRVCKDCIETINARNLCLLSSISVVNFKHWFLRYSARKNFDRKILV